MRKKPIKEVVYIRARQLRSGGQSLYLDYTNNRGKRVYENLRLYLVPDDVPNAASTNANTMRAAEAIKAERVMELLSGKVDVGMRRSDMLLADVHRQWVATHTIANTIKCHNLMGKWLMRYAGERATLRDIDREFCAGFSEELRTEKGFKGKPLNNSTARTLWQCFVAMLSWAFRKGWISENPCLRLEHNEKPHAGESTREFLTIEELRRFVALEPTDHYLRAYLFGCFCGLRWGDIKALRWGDISVNDGRASIRKIMEKTKKEVVVPLSESAARWLPQRDMEGDDAQVFKIKEPAVAQVKVRSAAAKIGITKHLTFHTSRHTFATTLLTRGADLYTTSKLLGHTNIKTTQVYARIVDTKKREAVDLLDGI